MDNKVITEKKYGLKKIGKLIQGKSAPEKAITKAFQLAKIVLQDFSKNGIDVVIVKQPRFEGVLLKVDILAKKGEQEILNDTIGFLNPPIMVPTGTFYEYTDPITKEVKLKENVEENLEEALKIIIFDTVEMEAKKK